MSDSEATSQPVKTQLKLCPHCRKDFRKDNIYNMEKHVASCRTRPPPKTKTLTDYFKAPQSKQQKCDQSINLNEGASEIIELASASSSMYTHVEVLQGSTSELKYCQGLKLYCEEQFYCRYPFQEHSNKEKYCFVPFNGSVYADVCIKRNMKLTDDAENVCGDCTQLRCDTKLKGMLDRGQQSSQDLKHVNNIHLNYEQLTDKLESKVIALKQEKLNRLASSKFAIHLQEKLGMYKKLISLLAENDIPRLKQIIAICVRQKRSTSYIVSQLSKAVKGLYSPKGYSERDFDIAGMVLLIGGPRLLNVIHQTSGMPSISHTYRLLAQNYKIHEQKLIVTCVSDIRQQLKINLRNVTGKLSFPTGWSLKLDEISIEKRLRYLHNTNEIVGLCMSHTSKGDVVFNSEHTIQNLEEKLDNGSTHLATEACVLAIACVSDKQYHGRPLLILPICDHSTSSEQGVVFDSVLSEWDSECGIILNIGTDGDGVRRRVLHSLCQKQLFESSIIYHELAELKLMDFSVGEWDLTVNYDPKHMTKRLTNLLIGGGIRILDTTIDSILLTPLLLKLGYKQSEVNNMLNPRDKQNVPAAVRLLEIFDNFNEWNTKDFTPGMVDMLASFRALQVICSGILSLFGKPNLSIEGALIEMSSISHILLYLYRQDSKLMPNVLYHDIQSTVKDLFFVAAKYKVSFPNSPLYYYQLGSDQVEQLFSAVRTQTHDRSRDVQQLETRLHRAEVLESLYSKHPEWKQKSNRLSGPVDHTSSCHWTANLKCGQINFESTWEAGKAIAKSSPPPTFDYNVPKRVGTSEQYNIMKPLGQTVGVSKSVDVNISNADSYDDSLDNNNALIQFEDDINEQVTTDTCPTVLIEGSPVYKSSVLKQITSNVGSKKSGDHLRRVQGISKYPNLLQDCASLGSEQSNEQYISVKDIVSCIAISSSQLHGESLCLFICDEIVDISRKKVSYIEINQECTLMGRVLKLTEVDNG